MLNIRPILQKNKYDLSVEDKQYIIKKGNKEKKMNQLDFEKLMFVKLVELIDEIIDENN